MVKEVADACRKHGLKMGVYLYPDDSRFASGIGRSGHTDDPARQEEWSKLYIRQWEEVLTICGPDLVNEIWLDGGCTIDIDPTIQRLAPHAVLFGGTKRECLRWVGNEKGIAPDVNWNAIQRCAWWMRTAIRSRPPPPNCSSRARRHGNAWAARAPGL